MTVTRDHGNWKKEHKQWLADHKKWARAQKKVMRNAKTLAKALNKHQKAVKKLAKSAKKHDRMMGNGNSRNHVAAMHRKYKKAHKTQNSRHKMYTRANNEILKINKAIENTIKFLKV